MVKFLKQYWMDLIIIIIGACFAAIAEYQVFPADNGSYFTFQSSFLVIESTVIFIFSANIEIGLELDRLAWKDNKHLVLCSTFALLVYFLGTEGLIHVLQDTSSGKYLCALGSIVVGLSLYFYSRYVKFICHIKTLRKSILDYTGVDIERLYHIAGKFCDVSIFCGMCYLIEIIALLLRRDLSSDLWLGICMSVMSFVSIHFPRYLSKTCNYELKSLSNRVVFNLFMRDESTQ